MIPGDNGKDQSICGYENRERYVKVFGYWGTKNRACISWRAVITP